MTKLDARNQKNFMGERKIKWIETWYTNEQWMNRMHKLRRNFTIKKIYAIKIFSCNIVCGSVSKQNVIYTNLSIKV